MGDSYTERDPRAPAWAQSAIIAELHKDDSDLMTDYFASSVHKRVILAWWKHRGDLFPELRAAALTFEPTRFLGPGCDDHHVYVALAGDVQSNGAAYWKGQISPWHKDQERRFNRPEEAVAYMREHAPDPLVLSVDGHDVSFVWAHGIKSYEHREKWSLGHGYYLGADRYSGWHVRKLPACVGFIRDAEDLTARPRPVAAASAPAANGGIDVRRNEERDGLEIRFPSKPAAAILERLKLAGWRWSRFSSCQ